MSVVAITRLDRMDARFDCMDERFDAFDAKLDVRFAEIRASLERIEGAVVGLGRRTTRLEERL